MKKILLTGTIGFLLTGCAPGYVASPEANDGYNSKLQEAKRKDAEFAEKVRNINLETADVGSKPTGYKQAIEDAIKDELKDPDSAKFTGMTTPRKEVMVERKEFVYGYSACVYVNAKNSYGGYTGKELYWAFMRDNKVLRVTNTNSQYGSIIFVGRPINCN